MKGSPSFEAFYREELKRFALAEGVVGKHIFLRNSPRRFLWFRLGRPRVLGRVLQKPKECSGGLSGKFRMVVTPNRPLGLDMLIAAIENRFGSNLVEVAIGTPSRV
jgi:hypothetical protein